MPQHDELLKRATYKPEPVQLKNLSIRIPEQTNARLIALSSCYGESRAVLAESMVSDCTDVLYLAARGDARLEDFWRAYAEEFPEAFASADKKPPQERVRPYWMDNDSDEPSFIGVEDEPDIPGETHEVGKFGVLSPPPMTDQEARDAGLVEVK